MNPSRSHPSYQIYFSSFHDAHHFSTYGTTAAILHVAVSIDIHQEKAVNLDQN